MSSKPSKTCRLECDDLLIIAFILTCVFGGWYIVVNWPLDDLILVINQAL